MAKPDRELPSTTDAGRSPTRVADDSGLPQSDSADDDGDIIYLRGPRFWGIAAAFVIAFLKLGLLRNSYARGSSQISFFPCRACTLGQRRSDVPSVVERRELPDCVSLTRRKMVSIASMFFLTTVDITIATTSLVAITADLGNFEMSSWILTSYQIGYVGKLQCSRPFLSIPIERVN